MRYLKSEAGVLGLWLLFSLLGAALLTPWLYGVGKAFAESAAQNDYPALIESVAKSARRAKSERYFSRSLLLSGLALLPLLICYIRSLPNSKRKCDHALRKSSFKEAIIQFFGGVLSGFLSIGILAAALIVTSTALFKGDTLEWQRTLSKALFPALGAGIAEELIFRGLLLGLFLRACSAHKACLLAAIFFSLVHFLKPLQGLEVSDPRAWYAGFEILSMTLAHFTDLGFLFGDFTTLIILGIILGWARVRTHALWLPIGLHFGLVIGIKSFCMQYLLDKASPFHPWLIGDTMISGLLPMLVLGGCFLLCERLSRKWQPPR